ncbi:MAG: hypothetical protein ACRCV7_00665 [Culicoidibacterales bacterium]
MDIKLCEYLIFNNRQEIAKKKEIKDFIDQMKRDEVFYFDNTNNAYILKNQKEENERVLLHFYQSNEINYENFRRGQEKFDFLDESDQGDIKSIKHIFIYVDYTTRKFYMNHIFKSLDRVTDFLGYNSSVFKKN